MSKAISRIEIADYLNIAKSDSAADNYVLMGFGFNTLNESPSAQAGGKTYINQKAQSNRIKSYQPSFPFDTDLLADEAAIMALYDVGRNQMTGEDAEKDYVRVELFQPVASKQNTFKARKFRVAVQVDSIEGGGGEEIKVTGNLLSVGDFIDGEFNTTTKTFTEATPNP